MNTKRRLSLFLVVLFSVFAVCVPGHSKEPINVRVAVLKGIAEAVVSVSGSFEIVDARTQVSLHRGKNLGPSRIVAVPGGLKIKDMMFYTDALAFIARKKAALTVNNRHYRGEIRVFKEAEKLLVVNVLDLESYIKGVLYHEISHKWPIDAIKAQAVASRTFAIYQKEIMKLKDYDLTADTSSQVYGGYASEKHKTNRAVNFTFGEVLHYKGRIFPAFFHAACAGITEDAGELWKVDGIEPLKGGRVCSFCRESPHYYWKATVDFKTIQKKLGASYKLKGDLKNIAVAERNPTGRVRSLELKNEKGESLKVSAKDFRHLVGPDLIRSTNFTIVFDDKDRLLFNGKGWGHGAGLCQWGALGMSKKGYGYKEILEFYYPGSEIVKIQ